MGNAWLNPCCKPSRKLTAKLILAEGTTRTLTGKKLAGEIMFEFPDCMVLHADSFFIGHRIPALAVEDELIMGHTYFVLPIDRLPTNSILSPSSLPALMNPSSSPRALPMARTGDPSPFEYIRGTSSGVLIKVVPEFITRLLSDGEDLSRNSGSCSSSPLICSTPELRKQYQQLVRPKEQVWSPKLATISEYNVRLSPCRFIGLELKQKEREG
ncbi:hypothetical protein Nepgr_009464 [Nepenthes gracilis]|uniref:Uncharacterized protein n=1 Tax=Nepenthes gracilis TaxID=150966 RepID=A0AAD3SBC1_NEPGR|nr:hypothetical protein Nepgr_009464 [Nepenthes gracilis]